MLFMVSIQLVHHTVHLHPCVTALPETSSDSVGNNILEPTSPDQHAVVRGAPQPTTAQRPAAPVQQWTPRLNASYLTRGANGTWCFRMVVPARAQNPALPHEIRRSTKTAQNGWRSPKREKCVLSSSSG